MSMMNVGKTTKTWSESQQNVKYKPDDEQAQMLEQQKKALGDKDVGTYLNEVADPNYIDPAKTRKVGKKDLDKDAFFKLMLAQVKYQSPYQPMENHELAAQLAQFTSLEQLYNVNENLAGMKKMNDPMAQLAAAQLIGKNVIADSSQLIRVKGDTQHELKFKLAANAQSVVVKIMDSSGTQVRELKFNDQKMGERTISWNGTLEDGQVARAGEYSLKFEAIGTDGTSKINVETKTAGKITGVNYTQQGPILMIGQQTLKMSDIKKIEDNVLPESSQTKKTSVPQPVSAAQPDSVKKETKEQGAEPALTSNLEDVAMERSGVGTGPAGAKK